MIKYCIASLFVGFQVLFIFNAAYALDGIELDKPKPTNCTWNETKDSGKVTFNNKDASYNCYWIIAPANNTPPATIFLMMNDMILDDKDVVTIRKLPSNETLFNSTGGMTDVFVLITNHDSVSIELNTSASTEQRHFAVSYRKSDCTFTIDPEVSTLSQPIYGKNVTDKADCKYEFNLKNLPDITFAFNFEVFQMNQSTVEVDGATEVSGPFKGSELPPDFMSLKDQVVIDIHMDPSYPEDKFRLKRRDVYKACSKYMSINGLEKLNSPQPLKPIDMGDIPIECLWHIANSENHALGVKINSIRLLDSSDILTIVNGPNMQTMPFLQISEATQAASLDHEIRSSASQIKISFKPSSFESNFSADVFDAGSGEYMKNNGTVKVVPNTHGDNLTVLLLEVNKDQNVILNFKDFSLSAPTLLDIYEDFSVQSRKIASLRGNVWYPIISPTSKMMVQAVNFKSGQFEATFSGATSGCMHMSPGVSDSYSLYGNCNSVCGWIIPPVDVTSDLTLNLQYLNLEKDDRIQVLRLDSKKTVVADVTASVPHVPQISLSSLEGAYVNISRGACPKKEDQIILVAHSNYLPDCSKNYTISPYETLNLTSPNFPNMYPLLSECLTTIKRSSDNQLLHLTFGRLDMAPNHCLNIMQISKNSTDSFSLTGNQMPDDYLFSGDMVIKFDSRNCNMTTRVDSLASGQGFLINLVTTDCGKVATDKAGSLLVPANATMCIFKVFLPQNGSDGSVNTIVYNMTEDKVGNYEMSVYDGGSVRDATIKNSSESMIWSRTNSLIFVYKRSNLSKPSSAVTIKYELKNCDKSMICGNGICMHPDWKCNFVNDCGDYSDERNCTSLPVPTGDKYEAGVSSVTFGVCICVFFILGLALALLAPKCYEKYRGYHRFQDISVIE